MGIRGKLLTGVGGSLAALLLAAVYGLLTAWVQLGAPVPAEVAQSNTLAQLTSDFRIQVQEWKNVLLRGSDEGQRTKYWEAFQTSETAVQQGLESLLGGVDDPTMKGLLEQTRSEHEAMGVAYRRGFEAFVAAEADPSVGDAAVKGVDREATRLLAEASKKAGERAAAAVASATDRTRRDIDIALILVALITVVVLVVLPRWLNRAVIFPLQSVARAATSVAHGDLDVRLEHRSDDELGQLSTAMRDMVQCLQRFRDAQAEVSRAHAAGQIGTGMPLQGFAGAWADMAERSNATTGDLRELIEQIVAVSSDYAKGDFSRALDDMPGEKARISAAMQGVRQQFVAMRDAIQRLAKAAAEGEFSVRGDADAFQHDFRTMVQALNTLMSTAESGLTDVARMLRAMAAGDLRVRMTGDFRGMFDTLKRDANQTADQLAVVLRDILNTAESVDGAAREIAAGNADLGARTEQQAASLEETASSMEQLTAAVRSNADSASNANTLARATGQTAKEGGTVVNQVVETMQQIDASSTRIADIISVIDGIAFQTNILALNAAVEAARAGEQGRGFAVVASEVRALAQRSADAAKEIKGLIGESSQRVSQGSALVSRAGETISHVVEAVQKLTELISEIAAASAEQSSGIEQVNHTVTHMDQTTQQNAALVEEATAAARHLETQATQLRGMVSRFSLQ